MSEVLEQNWIYIAIAYAALMVYLVYSFLFSNRGKIKVRVKTPTKEWVKWCKPQPDGETIIVEKAKAKKAGWKFKFTNKSLLSFSHWGRLFQAIDIFYNSAKAIEYEYKTAETLQPLWDKNDEATLFKASVIKAAGATTQKFQVPTILYLLIFVNVALTFIILLFSTGRLRI